MNDLNLFTDASGTIGFGIYYQSEWLAEPWPDHIIQSDYSIQWKELFPHCCSGYNLGASVVNQNDSDNHTVVDILQNGSVNCPYLTHLLHQIFFLCAKYIPSPLISFIFLGSITSVLIYFLTYILPNSKPLPKTPCRTQHHSQPACGITSARPATL